MMKEKTYPSPQQQNHNELPPGTICQWCYGPIEKGEYYTTDSIYGYVHRDDNEFCVRTQEKVDKEVNRLYPTNGIDLAPYRVPFNTISELIKTFLKPEGIK